MLFNKNHWIQFNIEWNPTEVALFEWYIKEFFMLYIQGNPTKVIFIELDMNSML